MGGRPTSGRPVAEAPAVRPSPAGDAGLYGPDSEAWRLNREATLLLGAGPRALLLQVAHPLVAEGVAQHSEFRHDPWRRLQNTLKSYLAIVYGPTGRARREIQRLNALHRAIVGTVEDPGARLRFGTAYSARDPDLSLWVHATLVDSTMAVYDGWIEPLDRGRRTRYYAETLPIGRAFGIPSERLPADIDAFEAYVVSMLATSGPVHPTATSRMIADAILHPPLGPVLPPLAWVPPPMYAWLFLPALALLPASVRAEYGFRWRPLEEALAGWLTFGYRSWRPLVPRSLRTMPQALGADRRVRLGHPGS